MRFLPLQRIPAMGSGIDVRDSRPERLRLQVFSTSWRLCPPNACRSLFQIESALGVLPSELFSSHVAVRRLQRPCPPDVRLAPVHLAQHRPSQEPKLRAKKVRKARSRKAGPAFRASGHVRVRHPRRLVRSPTARSSPGIRPSRVFPLVGMERPSPFLPSWAYRTAASG
jgi:hypothetical protein